MQENSNFKVVREGAVIKLTDQQGEHTFIKAEVDSHDNRIDIFVMDFRNLPEEEIRKAANEFSEALKSYQNPENEKEILGYGGKQFLHVPPQYESYFQEF